MVIPNREVKSIYRTTVMQWFEEKVNADSREDLFDALISSVFCVLQPQYGSHRSGERIRQEIGRNPSV
jgi:hypothetical protein